MKANQASHAQYIRGRRLRWARNIVKRWEGRPYEQGLYPASDDVFRKRFERAQAMLLADKLRKT